ncbi:putative acetyltransferase [Acanthamoeba polyphaga mimivirus]|uniref:Acetyltransferase n=1 Tax=Acanthamoeba polyphaga mimivirus Kroon TaxID=3069720 RepID=A0A0G2Y2P8_9VIRU|nr:putative acetyltransferase [Acanthamoeba polyphaga mimivirus]AKI80015.1 putative acetyltransferase [Acanthamoeba polyphaga mimivirus Kroon]
MTNITVLEQLMQSFLSEYTFSNRDYFQIKSELPKFDPDIILSKTFQNKYGICMDLNYAFSHVLKKHGFNCYLVKAFEKKSDGQFYDIYHLTIIVIINGCKYLADVGFGKYFSKPIMLKNGVTVDKIRVEVPNMKNHENIYNILSHNKFIVQIKDSPLLSISDINDNYQNFFKAGPDDLPLCRKPYDRIYDQIIGDYVIPQKVEKYTH